MRAYLTVLTTDDYAVGAVALWESLRKTRPQHGFVIVLTAQVSDSCDHALQDAGLVTLRIDQHLEHPRPTDGAFRHWNNTFSKLLIFGLVQYEKLVYLDSDMMVLRNLDHLFEKPHMSAVVAGKLMPGHEFWVQFCSGLMVIEPQPGLVAKILTHLPATDAKPAVFGDQDLLNQHFPDWPSHEELHLEQSYGVFQSSLNRYVKQYGYNLNLARPDEKTIAVVHFLGSRKPWSWSGSERALRVTMHVARGEFVAAGMLCRYLRALRSAQRTLTKATPDGRRLC